MAQTADRITRRHLFISAGATVLLPTVAQAESNVDEDVEAEIAASVEIEIEEIARRRLDRRTLANLVADPQGVDSPAAKAVIAQGQEYRAPALSDPKVKQALGQKYWRVPDASRPAPAWAAQSHQPDYRHLGDYSPPETFDLMSAGLSALADKSAFIFSDKRPVRVIGIRGCQLANGAALSDWARTHTLRVATPDHIHQRCLLGLWRPSDGMIRLYRASTVPQVGNMFACLGAAKGWGTSLLPTGFYRYRAGIHKASTPERRQTGALLAEDQYIVLRTGNDLNYDPFQPFDVWTYGAAHNIHAAGRNLKNPRFDSSGCQVIQGWYQDAARLKADGPFDQFRRDAGLADADGLPKAAERPGKGTYEYMLVTGHEVAMAAQGGADFASYKILRPGSQGPRVSAAQAELYRRVPRVFGKPLIPDGYFTPAMSFASLIDKRLNGPEREYASPIVLG